MDNMEPRETQLINDTCQVGSQDPLMPGDIIGLHPCGLMYQLFEQISIAGIYMKQNSFPRLFTHEII